MSQPVSIRAITPRGDGYHFVCYADCCSGVPDALHEKTFGEVNAIVASIDPPPQFICFPGDEVVGLTTDYEQLRKQWQYWLHREMAWLNRDRIPVYHTTGNHTTYDEPSELVFREMLSHLPQNGPRGEEGLTYFVRRDDLLMVFVNTASSRLGGEGRVETEWLERTLAEHSDARFKLVFGHHPIFSVNGFGGQFQRDVERENGKKFWGVLVRNGVMAYFCSHILAFDVQVHQGVLQVVTAGAGTAHRMPADHEYLHCVQGAIDASGLRYQVIDVNGAVREWLEWPPPLPSSSAWHPLSRGVNEVHFGGDCQTTADCNPMVCFRFAGHSSGSTAGAAQTLLTADGGGAGLPPVWVGLTGHEQRVCVILAPEQGRSPHSWYGPCVLPNDRFAFELSLHSGMRPGGVLFRPSGDSPWSSLHGSSPWGPERLKWPTQWHIGFGRTSSDRAFRGSELDVRWQMFPLTFSHLLQNPTAVAAGS